MKLAIMKNNAPFLEKLKEGISTLEEAVAIPSLASIGCRNHGPTYLATALGNLAIGYTGLARVSEDKAAILHKAIAVFEKLLALYPSGKFPVDYALSAYNMANTYAALAEVENPNVNLSQAIFLCEAAFDILNSLNDQRAQIVSVSLETLRSRLIS